MFLEEAFSRIFETCQERRMRLVLRKNKRQNHLSSQSVLSRGWWYPVFIETCHRFPHPADFSFLSNQSGNPTTICICYLALQNQQNQNHDLLSSSQIRALEIAPFKWSLGVSR